MTDKEEIEYTNALSDLMSVSTKLNEYVQRDKFLSDLLQFSSYVDTLYLKVISLPETQRKDRLEHINKLRQVFTSSSRLWLENQLLRVKLSQCHNEMSAANNSLLEVQKRAETLQNTLDFINET